MPSIPIPQEILETIIAQLGFIGDDDSLRACTLVSHSFLSAAQPYLFRTVRLDHIDDRRKRHEHFHILLLEKPRLGTYVYNLRLGDEHDGSFGETPSSWITDTEYLCKILPFLNRLQTFSLSFSSEMTEWSSMSRNARVVLENLFELPSLRSVALQFISGVPARLLLSLTKLVDLSLSSVHVDVEDSLSETTQPANLSELVLRGCSPRTILTLHSTLRNSPKSLQRLILTPTHDTNFCASVWELMREGGSGITQFEWLPSAHYFSSIGPIDIGVLSDIRVLRYSASFRQRSPVNQPLNDFLSLLGQMCKQSNRVETIILECHYIKGDDAKQPSVDWKALDALLRRKEFCALQKVSVRLSVSSCPTVERWKFKGAFAYQLKDTRSHGVDVSIEDHWSSAMRWLA
ncbi:uncharacterized protein LACBIDRAFT_312861 [Laccaria bicolor S238N-H82]|uniref:Predicted protein n=1 Tax=Laccaria bicolor (strain S238N-H82 / ATCC MYA-4686) TaxID=486041 RepID=B0DWZ2_LACBS|nr:uncharacterized protein LACBIDRAFT_312861 [Laccaria bicolor S238N-H82]EDR00844.1 predicted protein [Laccaria bicolor S238N-H82]|eukprot:XP_001888438.1 predicted protein [Laccaria bicolor S238N-H82]